jgi:hypothetical protein
LLEGAFIVVDLGKTLSKVSLWSRDGRCLAKHTRANQPQPAAPYVALDLAATADWVIETLARFAGHPVEAIVPVAHGAAVVGIRDGVLAFTPPATARRAIPSRLPARQRCLAGSISARSSTTLSRWAASKA